MTAAERARSFAALIASGAEHVTVPTSAPSFDEPLPPLTDEDREALIERGIEPVERRS